MVDKRLIDADKLIDYFEGQCKIAEEDSDPISEYVLAAFKCCIDLFERFPTVDAVEVVRCRYCKYYDKECGYCEAMDFNRKYDDFCSYGERRPE